MSGFHKVDAVSRRKLEARVNRLWAAQSELKFAQEDADAYAAKLLLSEYGLIVGDAYTFPATDASESYRGMIVRAEGFFSSDGVALCVHVWKGTSMIKVFHPNIPTGAGFL